MDEKTKQRYYKLHWKFWDWRIENVFKKNRNEWPEWKKNGGTIPAVPNGCFLCKIYRGQSDYCSNNECPLYLCTVAEGLYTKWKYAKTKKEWIKYATAIRDIVLPFLEKKK